MRLSRDLGYFEYYISEASNKTGISAYTITYKFELYAVLLDELNLIPPILEDMAMTYYLRKEKSIFRRAAQFLYYLRKEKSIFRRVAQFLRIQN